MKSLNLKRRVATVIRKLEKLYNEEPSDILYQSLVTVETFYFSRFRKNVPVRVEQTEQARKLYEAGVIYKRIQFLTGLSQDQIYRIAKKFGLVRYPRQK